MIKRLTILTALGILIPSALFSQKKNRLALQSGLFNCFFDGSAIVNAKPMAGGLLGNRLNDSEGIEIMRSIKKSQISLEYMRFFTGYNVENNYGNSSKTAQYRWKQYRYISIFYHRRFEFSQQWDLQYGAGVTYSWGNSALYHYSFNSGSWSEAYYTGFENQNLGVDLKVGIEYSPIDWITLYSNFNFLASVFEEDDIDYSQSYLSSYPKNTPNNYCVSWRFGIGFNF